MAWIPSDKEIESIIGLDGAKRYEYCVKKVADQQTIWSLWTKDGWALLGNDEGKVLVPVWPHEKFALQCADNDWAGFHPRAIDLDGWLDRWIPGIERDSRLIAVFKTKNGKGVVVDPRRFETDLREALLVYE